MERYLIFSSGKGLSLASQGRESGMRLSATDMEASDAPEVIPDLESTGCQPVFSVRHQAIVPAEGVGYSMMGWKMLLRSE